MVFQGEEGQWGRGMLRRASALAIGVIFVLAPTAKAAGPPQLDAAWVTDVSAGSATFHGEVNPEGALNATSAVRGRAEQAQAETSEATVTQKGNLRVAVSGKLSPPALPRTGTAPIEVSVAGKVTTTDESPPPQLQLLKIEINSHGRLDYRGLPTCAVDQIQPASNGRALAACRSALVGQGSFAATIALPGSQPYPISGRLLVFNGRSHGHQVLLGHIYSPHPFATSFVITFQISSQGHGTYGTTLTANLTKALGTKRNLTGIEMTLGRRYSDRGKARSYLSAGCPAPKGFGLVSFPLARTTFGFAGGKKLTSILTRSCKVRG
jgi:hypothetical protein